jgi:heptosyltransferase-3
MTNPSLEGGFGRPIVPGGEAPAILIYRLGSLGDTVVALPAFHLIRESFPGSRITLLTNRPVATAAAPLEAVLGGGGFFDEVLDYPVGTRSPAALLELAGEIRRRKIAIVINLVGWRGWKNALRDRLFFRMAGVRKMIGEAAEKRDRDVLLDPATGLYEWETARLMRRLAPLGRPPLDEPRLWNLLLSPSELAEGQGFQASFAGRPFLVAGMGTKMPAKDWEESNWRGLMTRLAGDFPGWGLLLVGASEESERSIRCAQAWNGPIVDLCGKVTPRVCAAAMHGGAAFIGHDSGPMHLAACSDVPCVAIFSARNRPGHWFPRGARNRVIYHQTDCFGCKLEVCTVEKKKCILSISVDEVRTAVLELLGGAMVPEPRNFEG